jgi:hypothetical protein
MRIWHSGSGLLIERGPSSTVVLGWLLDASGRRWIEPPADYLLADAKGAPIEQYRTLTWSIEDELGADLHLVESDVLLRVRVVSRGPGRLDTTEQPLLHGLEAADGDDEDARDRARSILAREEQLATAESERREARVRRIEGAFDEAGLGPAFSAAQEILRSRISRYEEERSEELLRALLGLAALYRHTPCVGETLGTFVWACRRASYDRTMPYDAEPFCPVTGAGSRGGSSTLDGRGAGEASRLVGELQYLESALEKDADDQEYVDANANATTLRAAARGVGRSRALLEKALAACEG